MPNETRVHVSSLLIGSQSVTFRTGVATSAISFSIAPACAVCHCATASGAAFARVSFAALVPAAIFATTPLAAGVYAAQSGFPS